MAEYKPVRIPIEFTIWLEERRKAIARAVGIPNIPYTEVLRLISKTDSIVIPDKVLNKFYMIKIRRKKI